MALRTEIVDFIGLYFLHNVQKAAGIGQVSVMQDESPVLEMRILIDMVDPVGVEERASPFNSMNFITLA